MARLLLFLAILLFAFANIAYSQPAIPKNVNTLYTQLTQSKPDTARVNLLLGIGRYYNATSTKADSALAVASWAEKLSISLSYPKGTGLSYQSMAKAWCNKQDFNKSDVFIKKAINTFLSHNLFSDAAEAYLNMEEFYLSAGGKDYKIMIAYYEQALPLFQKSGAKLRAAATLQVLGDFYLQVNSFNHSINNLKQALIYYKATGERNIQSVYDLLGNNYLALNNFNEALKYALLAVSTAEAVKDTTMELCAVYNHIGLIYNASFQHALANNYFQKAITIAQKYHDESGIFLSSNYANSLIGQKQPAAAIDVLKKSELKFPDLKGDFRIYYDCAFLVAYMTLNQMDNAKLYCGKLLKAYQTPDGGAATQLNILGSVIKYFTFIHQYNQAANYLPAYINAGQKSQFKRNFILHAFYYSYLVDSAQHKPYAAIKNYLAYTHLKDSISESTKNRQIQELQIKYETEKKEKELTLLKKDSSLQQNKTREANHIRNLTLLATFGLLILISLLYYSYRINQKNSRKISEKNIWLGQLLKEKEWLIKEIHHRVKNNLQIVMGLLQRQSAYIDNYEALAAIQNSENRMHSIALIHQKLYQSDNLDLIYMPDYIDEMINYLKDSCSMDNRILFDKRIDEIYLDVVQAVPLGLILNEAITNAIKYAYRDDETGLISISLLKKDSMRHELNIKDDGRGLPLGFEIKNADSMGMNLMRGLSKQLGGTFYIGGSGGCSINIVFGTEIFARQPVEMENTLT